MQRIVFDCHDEITQTLANSECREKVFLIINIHARTMYNAMLCSPVKVCRNTFGTTGSKSGCIHYTQAMYCLMGERQKGYSNFSS